VTQPAANPAGMFSAFSRLPVDTFSKPQMETPIVEAKKEELSAPAPVAEIKTETPAPVEAPKAELAETPAAPAPAVETKAAEPTLGDIAAMLAELLGYMKKDEAEDIVEDMAAAKTPEAPAVVEAAAKTEPETLSRIEKDAAGAAPVPAQHADSRLSRTEILNQFNQETNPAKRVELLRKLGV
jgi:hypothetical protein